MTFWKLSRIGSGTLADPFRPDGMSGLAWGSWPQQDGSFMVWTDKTNTPASPTKQSLGTTLNEAENTLGISTDTIAASTGGAS